MHALTAFGICQNWLLYPAYHIALVISQDVIATSVMQTYLSYQLFWDDLIFWVTNFDLTWHWNFFIKLLESFHACSTDLYSVNF